MTPNQSAPSAGSPVTAIIIFFAFLVVFATPLNIPFFTRGEAREALVVQAMGQQDNLILPLRNGIDIPSKPPLFHWAGYFLARAANVDPGGTSAEFFIRLPSALASAAALAIFFLLFLRQTDRRASLLATIILGSSLDWMRASVVARVDMVFALFTAVAAWLLFELIEKRRNERPLELFDILLPAFALAAAGLAKGPAGVAMPGMVAALYAFLSLSPKKLPVVPALLILFIACFLPGLWYFAAWKEGGQRFVEIQILKENFARVAGSDEYDLGHSSGPLSIIPMIASGLLPWTFFLPLVFPLKTGWRRFQALPPAVRFSLVSALFYLFFFAFTTSKRNVYLLPSFPAWAFLCSWILTASEAFSRRALRISGALVSLFAAVLCVALFVLVNSQLVDMAPLLARLKVKPHDIETVEAISHTSLLSLLSIGCSIALLFASARSIFQSRVEKGAYLAGAAMLLLSTTVSLGILRSIAYRQTPEPAISSIAEIVKDGVLYQFNDDLYGVDYYLARPVKEAKQKAHLTDERPAYILVEESDAASALTALGEGEVIWTSPAPILYGRKRLKILRVS